LSQGSKQDQALGKKLNAILQFYPSVSREPAWMLVGWNRALKLVLSTKSFPIVICRIAPLGAYATELA
jgi:hypothetical protein